jgi:flagellar basal-body rod modification protein FlgD
MVTSVDNSVLESLGLSKKPKTTASNTEMGQDAFLKLVIAQLQNQDPMKPMENGEFLSQLAQFKSVTGIDDLRKSVDSMASSFQSNQALQASSLVGRWVMVASDTGHLWQDAGMGGAVEVPSSASQVLVSIKDSSGQVIKQIDLGRQEKGTVDFHWDGLDGNGQAYAPGDYDIEATANIGGEYEAIITNTVVPVDSVIMGKAGTDLTVNTVGLGRIKLSDVKQIM